MAKNHRRASYYWLGAGVAVFVSLLLYLAFVRVVDGDEWTTSVIAELVERAIIAFTLFGLIVFCLKNYRINQHLASTNHHRVTGLATYKSLLGLAKTDEKSDEILLEATKFIFAQLQTGYLGKDEETPLGQAIELARAVTGKS